MAFQIVINAYIEVSGFAVILYDHITTLDQEVNLIWHARWSTGKLLLVISRYQNLFLLSFQTAVIFLPSPTQSLCVTWIRWQWCIGIYVSLFSEIILSLRIYAMYGATKKIALLLVSGLSLSAGSTLVILSKLLHGEEIRHTALPAPDAAPPLLCVSTNLPSFWWTFWLPTFTFEILLFGLSLYKCYRTLRSKPSAGWSGRATMDILVRDSIFYFLVVFSIYLANFLLWTVGGVKFIEVMVVYTVTIPSIMSQRLLLNVRSIRPPTVDTAQADIGTWRVPGWPSGADIERQREAEEEARLRDLVGDGAAIQRPIGGSNMELDVFVEGGSGLSGT